MSQEALGMVETRGLVAAIEAEDGQIFTGYCFEATSGVFHLCAERAQHLICSSNLVKRL